MTFAISAGINSTVKITDGSSVSTEFTATTSVERTQEADRIDVTGFGATSRSTIAGLLSPREYTIRTYSEPAGLAVGVTRAYEITFAGGAAESGSAIVASFSSSADLEGATVHEITLVKTS